MPAASAASTSPVPFGTSTRRSSTVTATSSDMRDLVRLAPVHRGGREDPLERRVALERTAAELDVGLVLVAELVDVAQDRDRVRVAERAQALPEDPVAHREQEVE